MKKVVIASNNPGKLREFAILLAPFDFEAVPQGEFGVPEANEPHFTFIENAVQANIKAAAAPAEKVAGKLFNVATGERYDLNQMFGILRKIIGFQGEPVYREPRTGDVKHSLADISKARSAFGYAPEISFEEGLRRTVEWYRTTQAGQGVTASTSKR